MKLELRRIILFVQDMKVQTHFYQEVLGLPVILNPDQESRFIEFDAGGCRIALHSGGTSAIKSKAPKLAFYTDDIVKTRDWLMERGAKMGAIKGTEPQLCDGKDPEGNLFQLSTRP